jgi:two-component system, sensor histidine kinase and response regulator
MTAPAKHILLLTRRPEVLDGVLQAGSGPASVTAVETVDRFSRLAERHSFHGFVLDVEEQRPAEIWEIFFKTRLRHPQTFFALLLDRAAEDVLPLWLEGAGGWIPFFPPYPTDILAAFLDRWPAKPILVFEEPDAEAEPFSVIKEAIRRRQSLAAGTQEEIRTALAADPAGLLVIHAARPTPPLAVLLRAVFQAAPAARVALFFDEPLEEALAESLRTQSWCALPAAPGLALLWDRWQDKAEPARGAERILVVDDEPNLLDLAVDVLTEEGFEVDGVPSGKAALQAARQKNYQAALVDFQLGDTTGLALSRQLREIDEDIPVILITAYASLDMAVQAIQADVYDYLVKPLNSHQLKRSIRKALEARRLAVENKRLLAHLQKANHQLGRLNQLKTKFLSVVSHDLRTPLTSIKGYAELVNTHTLAPDQQRRFLGIIAKETDRLSALIGDLVDFAGIEAGKLRVEKKPMDLAALVDGVRNRMEVLAADRKIQFRTDLDLKDFSALQADSRRLDQALTNLLTNAFKHTPSGGTVTLTIRQKEGRVYAEVADTGEGIPPQELPRLFEQFYQVESHASKREGLGLGLTITKEIIELHGGEIGVFSEGVGRGARFWFTLPLGPGPQPG